MESTKPNSLEKPWHLALKILLSLSVFFAASVVALILFIRSESGREFARKNLNTLLSGKIAGNFELKHLDEIQLHRVVGRDLVITAPNGEKVIELHDISLEPVWTKILLGKIEATSAVVTGGIFRITETGPTLSIIKALNGPPKPPGEKGGKPIRILMEDIHAKDIQVDVKSNSMPPMSFKDIQGLIRFETMGKVVVTLEKASGHVDFPVLGDTKLRNVNGDIRSKVMDVIDFDLNMELGDLVPTHFIYRVPKNEKKPGDPKMVIRFSKEKSPSFFPKLILTMADALTSFVDVGFYEK